MARWLSLILAVAAAATPLELTVDPQPGASFVATFVGPASGIGAGDFRGSLAWNGSLAQMPLSGRAESAGGLLRLRAAIRYADVPADWLDRFRPDGFDYRILGEVAGSGPVSWSGTLAWERVMVAAGDDVLSRFAKLTSLELTDLSSERSEGRAVLAVTNPFSFPVPISAVRFGVWINGEEVGEGRARGRVLSPRKRTGVELPFRVDQRRFLAAAGGDWAVGAPVETKLTASLTFRLASGDRPVPLEVSGLMGTDGARSGVFTLPEGATSLSPRR